MVRIGDFKNLSQIRKKYKHVLITLEDAVKESGLGSTRTFYRRIKELEDKN